MLKITGKTAEKEVKQRFYSEKEPVEGARLGKDVDGNPAWFIKDPDRPGKYLQVERTE